MAEEKQAQDVQNEENTGIDLGASLERKAHREKKKVNKGLIALIAVGVIIVGVAAGLVIPRLIPEKEEEVVDLAVTLTQHNDSDLASISVEGKVATITGTEQLHGAVVEAHDLRAGAALIIAGLAAEGTTVVENIHFVERGYEKLIEKMTSLGADIHRID